MQMYPIQARRKRNKLIPSCEKQLSQRRAVKREMLIGQISLQSFPHGQRKHGRDGLMRCLPHFSA